jgi:hypothetical protein
MFDRGSPATISQESGGADMRTADLVQTAEALAIPDLGTQLEDLFATVWAAEANWRLDDRIALALKGG